MAMGRMIRLPLEISRRAESYALAHSCSLGKALIALLGEPAPQALAPLPAPIVPAIVMPATVASPTAKPPMSKALRTARKCVSYCLKLQGVDTDDDSDDILAILSSIKDIETDDLVAAARLE